MSERRTSCHQRGVAVRIGIPRESKTGETLVAATGATVAQLRKLGYDVVVEAGAGAASDQPDAAYAAAEVDRRQCEEVWSSDVVVKVNAPTPRRSRRLRRGAVVISLMAPARSPELVEALAAAGVTGVRDGCGAADLARPVDGRALLDGQRRRLPRGDRGAPTRSGGSSPVRSPPPARCRRPASSSSAPVSPAWPRSVPPGSMGAIVRAFDVRPEVAEQVESMGAQFVTVDDGARRSPPTATPRR